MDDAFEYAVRLVEAFIFASAKPLATCALSRLVPMPHSAPGYATAGANLPSVTPPPIRLSVLVGCDKSVVLAPRIERICSPNSYAHACGAALLPEW